MSAQLVYAALVTGLAGGIHCLGMCGAIVGVMNAGPRPPAVIAVQRIAGSGVAVAAAAPQTARGWAVLVRAAAYHAGRLCTYALLGAAAGTIGSTVMLARYILPVQQMMYFAAVAMLILIGVRLFGLPSPLLGSIERLGARLWASLKPSAGTLLAGTGMRRAVLAGLVWGAVPCALVYSTLTLALLAGSAGGGALVMLAFGLGTTPHLALGSVAARKASRLLSRSGPRRAAGATLVILAASGLLHSMHIDLIGPLTAWCGLRG